MTRRILTILLFLVIGAILNVAVAWTFAATLDVGRGSVLELYKCVDDSHHWEVFRWDRGAGTRVMSRSWRGQGPAEYNEGNPELLLARWGSIESPDLNTTDEISRIDEAWGYPMRAIALRFTSSRAPDGTTTTTENYLKLAATGRSLPVEPLWAGFAVNSIIYALASLVIYALGRDAISALRHRRAPA